MEHILNGGRLEIKRYMAGIDQGKRMAGGSTILKMAKSNLKETTKTENGMDW